MTALLAAYRWLIETIRRGFDWLRRPGNTVKAALAAILLALIYWGATATLRSYAQGQRIMVLVQERDAATVRVDELLTVIEGYKEQEAAFASRVRAEAEQLAAARKESGEAMKDAASSKAAAARSESGWMKEYRVKPDSCSAALQAMEVACASFSSY